ncbi:MAG: nitrous oxide reductase family maturation protein NosD [Gemmatimonadaceae bacterium]
MRSSIASRCIQLTLLAISTLASARVGSAQSESEVHVSPTGPVRTVAEGLRRVRNGGRVVVEAGRYREPVIVVTRPVELVGKGWPTLDGEGSHEILLVAADDVTVRGLAFTNVSTSYVEDRAAIRVKESRKCNIVDNRLDHVFFGIYLAKSAACRIERNDLRAANTTETSSGNGIHLWSTRDVVIANNRITGFRDGLYFEFVHEANVYNNLSTKNLRYGLHFMYSDDCEYRRNIFRNNGSGVAVMYTHRVAMIGNTFENNWGAAAYGLLLKEISDAHVERNIFRGNTTGLVADGANRIEALSNDFIENGWAIRLDASTVDGRIALNNFAGNTFDIASNSQNPTTAVAGNYWDTYRGYDLNRDGVGDVPFHPVRLFSMIVERNEPALILLRSGIVQLLDAAERVFPILTPEGLADAHPAMRRIK